MNNPAAQSPTARNSRHVSTACMQCRRRKIRCDNARPCHSCTTAGIECRASDVPDGRSRRRMADREESSAPPFETPPNPFIPQTSNRELAHQVITLENNIANVQQEMQQLTARSMQTAQGIARLQQFLPRHPQVPGMAPSGMHAVSHSLPPPPVPPSRQYSAAPAGYGATPQPFSSLHSNGAYTPTTHLHPGVHIPSTPPTWNPSAYGAPPRAGGPPQSSPFAGPTATSTTTPREQRQVYPNDATRYWDPRQ